MRNLLFAVLLIATTSLTAQSEFRIGVKAGIGTGTLTDAQTTESTYVTWLLGLQADYKIKENLSVGAELYYTRFGAENNDSNDYLYLDYLNLPILAKIKIVDNLKLHVGPEIGFLLSADVNEINANELFNATNFSGVLGLGYEFNEHFDVNVRYHLGLSDVSDMFITKTSLLGVSVGYYF